LEQLRGSGGKRYAEDCSRNDADEHSFGALSCGQTGRRQADDNGVVASQYQVDHDDLKERREFARKTLEHGRELPASCLARLLADEPIGCDQSEEPYRVGLGVSADTDKSSITC
jgi:hypothetical protein